MTSLGTKTNVIILLLCFVIVYKVVEIFFFINYGAIPAILVKDFNAPSVIPMEEILQEDRSIFNGSRQDQYLTFVSGFHKMNCGCPNKMKMAKEYTSKDEHRKKSSVCSNEATIYGMNQKVVSFSLHATSPEELSFLLDDIQPNLDGVRKFFPDWIVRIYTSIPVNRYSCRYICDYDILFWCDVREIPGLGNVSKINPMLWRYMVVGDPTVDVLLVRNLGSTVNLREKMAVMEWENSNQSIHVIRDSQWHNSKVLPGLFGFKNFAFSLQELKKMRTALFTVGRFPYKKLWVSRFVQIFIYSGYHERVMAHDSYFCGEFPDGVVRPFPTQRIGQEFVGRDDRKELHRFLEGRIAACPKRCRPSFGKNWTYC